MSVIIRLQGLPWTASAMNIRHFFHGLNIPAGGVHIIGGEGGDAFIAFSSDEDARMAMKMNMSLLNGVPVHLFLSSKSEMQSVIDAARSGNSAAQTAAATGTQAMPTAQGAMTGMGQVGVGVGPGHSMAAKGMGADQTQQMAGYPSGGMQNQGQTGMMASKDNYMMMQQQQQQSSAMGGGLGTGGMNARNNWQGHAGMMGQGQGDNQTQNNNMNMPYFQQNSNNNMMGVNQQRSNDQFSRYSNMNMPQQVQNMPENAYPGFGQRDMYGQQGQGQNQNTKMDDTQMKNVPPHGGMMMPGQNLYGASGMGASSVSSVRGGSAESEKLGQQASNVDKMVQGLLSSQRAGSKGKDESVVGGEQMARGLEEGRSSLPKDRYGASPIGMDPTRAQNLNARSWGVDNKGTDNFSNQSRFTPDTSRDSTLGQDMNMNRDDPFFKREGRRRPNRFAERPDTDETPAGVGMKSDSMFPDSDGRMPSQFRGNRPEPGPGGFPHMGQSYPDRDGGKKAGSDDGTPSTRYPPDEDSLSAGPDGDRMAGARGQTDNFRGMSDEARDGRFPRGMDEQRDFYRGDRQGFHDNRQGFPNDPRNMSDDNRRDNMFNDPSMRDMPDDRGFHPRGSRFDRDDPRGDQRDPMGRFPPDEGRGYPRHPRDNRFDSGMERDDRFPDRPGGSNGDRRMRGGDNDPFPPRGEGRPPMSDDRPDMWSDERRRADEMMGRRPGDNQFPPDDPRYRDREEELRREAFERGFRGPEDRFMYGRGGRGGMRGMGRPDGDNFSMRPGHPDQRGGFPDRHGRFRDGDREPYPPFGGPDRYPDGPDQRKPFDRKTDADRPDMDGPPRPGLLNKPDGPPRHNPTDRDPMLGNQEGGDQMDMDQRYDHEMDMGPGPGRRGPGGMFRENEDFDYGRGPPMDEGFGRGGPPRDFDNRAVGPRGRGGPFMDRGGRGRGDPFGRGRPGGMPPFGRGRGRDGDMHFEEHGMMDQDVDNRMMGEGRFPNAPQLGDKQHSGMPDKSPAAPGITSRGLLGDSPGDAAMKKPDSRPDGEKRDVDSRPPRRSDDRDRDRRYHDDRRSSRDDRDRYSYRGRHDRDRDRDRDRRRSRSRSRDRSRDRDSRYSRDNRDRSSKDKADTSKGDSAKGSRPTRFLQLKNMPKTVSFRDIRRFFYPMEIPFDGIKLINNNEGDRIGEGFVYFNRLDDASRAFRKNGERMEGQPLNITYTTEDEFHKAIDSFVPTVKKDPMPPKVPTSTPNQPGTPASESVKTRYIVQMKQLPLAITRQDIRNFFKNLKIENNGDAAYIEFDQEGVATGIGFVEFTSDLDYKKALTQDGNLLGAKNVRVLPGKPEEADKMKEGQREMFQRAALRNITSKTSINVAAKPPQGQQPQQQQQQLSAANIKPLIPAVDKNEQDGSCVHIQGLPLLATPHDIREFFSDCQIVPRGINIAHDGAGKPLGEGFVEFKSKADFDKALKKDKTSLGRHIVAVKPISKKEMVDRLENAKNRGGVPPKVPSPLPPTSQPSSEPTHSPTKNPFKYTAPQSQPPKNQGPPQPLMQDNSPRPNNNSNNPMNPSQQQQQSQSPRMPSQPPQQPANQQTQPLKPPVPPSQQQHAMKQGPQPPNHQQQPPRQDNMMMNKEPGPPPHNNQQQQPHLSLLHSPPMSGPPLVVAPGGGKSFPPGVLNNNWFYLRCQNFPPDITIADIMQFFHSFRAIGESVRLHYSTEGHPTGNAVVGFSSAEDANRALQRLHGRMCRHNPIGLQPA